MGRSNASQSEHESGSGPQVFLSLAPSQKESGRFDRSTRDSAEKRTEQSGTAKRRPLDAQTGTHVTVLRFFGLVLRIAKGIQRRRVWNTSETLMASPVDSRSSTSGVAPAVTWDVLNQRCRTFGQASSVSTGASNQTPPVSIPPVICDRHACAASSPSRPAPPYRDGGPKWGNDALHCPRYCLQIGCVCHACFVRLPS
jgi:hypothetical protein